MTARATDKIRVILGKILDEHTLGADSGLSLHLKVNDLLEETDIDKDQFLRIMKHLQEKEIISHYELWKENKAKWLPRPEHPFIEDFNICSVDLPRDFQAKSQSYLSILPEAKSEIETAPNAGLILYFDQIGNFWHGDKNELCYPMGEQSNRFSILKYLIENKGFQTTDAISSALGGKDKQNVRTEISKIRRNISSFLKIDGNDVIEAKKDSGYRINPKYKIIER